MCLLPQAMHLLVWDTARTWTYSILCAFLLLWIDVETPLARVRSSQFVRFVLLAALLVNAIAVTPLMDGLRERFEVTTRLLMYAPVFLIGLGLARQSRRRASGEPGGSIVT
jgi:peptidoglycan/LPS O-acetylase OafA/YrhL